MKKFGITHFEEHTGIPPELAKEILKGFERIDYELDEILWKLSNEWNLSKEGIEYIPANIELPADIQAHYKLFFAIK